MKTRFPLFTFSLLVSGAALSAAPRDAQWAEVEAARNARQPKTAIERLEPIIAAALAENAYPEAIKAIAAKTGFAAEIQGRKPEEKIRLFQAEVDKAPAPMKPVMQTILAHLYWQYFQQNRWQLMKRTRTASSGDDFQTWDLARILAEIDRHYTVALRGEAELKRIPIGDYDALLAPAGMPDRYRPTLFDFLVYQALQFYSAGEHAATAAEDEFEIKDTDPIFGTTEEFLAWRPTTSDTTSPKLKAIRLYQSLLSFHQPDADGSAYDEADLARLEFGSNVATGEEKDARCKAALERFIDRTKGNEVSALGQVTLARKLQRDGKEAEAHALAQRARQRHPDSPAAPRAANLIQQIESPSLAIATESVWNAPLASIEVTYRNLTRIYFRAVPVSFETYLERYVDRLGEQTRHAELLRGTPALSWEKDLPPTKDFKERTEPLPAPDSLRPGFYLIFASDDASFAMPNHDVRVVPVWVSDLALIIRTVHNSALQSGLVLDARTGAPLAGAMVRIWQRGNRGTFQEILPCQTDENGLFQFRQWGGSIMALARYGEQFVSTSTPLHHYGSQTGSSDTHTALFTDRAVYRPGQTIHYKGVSIRADTEAGTYASQAGTGVTVVLMDRNNQEIARASHVTNDYGSFSGTFTAPSGRALGSMSIRVPDAGGSTSFLVEEYKRPKFQVEVAPPTAEPKLGEPVSTKVKATAYTGAAIGGAKVKWRVERRVSLPFWTWEVKVSPQKAVAHGSAVTAADGTLTVTFTAAADPAIQAKHEPVYFFTVHADVTDSSGETRSARIFLPVGYSALVAEMTADALQTPDTPIAMAIATRTLGRKPASAKGTVTVHRLIQPDAVVRAPLNPRPLRTHNPENKDRSNPDAWELGEVVRQKTFETDATGTTNLDFALQSGVYRVVLETQDRFGQTATARHTLTVVDPSERKFPIKLPHVLLSSNAPMEPGVTYRAVWGTGYEHGRALVELECNGQLLTRYWTDAGRSQQAITLPITGEMRGGVSLRVTHVQENRAYIDERLIEVPWSDKQLSIKWERFRSRLGPGQKEVWTAIVTGTNASRAAAEMVATLYDASLDQFRRHAWSKNFGIFRRETLAARSQFQNKDTQFTQLSYRRHPGGKAVPQHRTFPYYATWNRLIILGEEVVQLQAFSVKASADGAYFADSTLAGSKLAVPPAAAPPMQTDTPEKAEGVPDLARVSTRSKLNETAFFFPHLQSDENGVVKLTFTMPDSVTEWKFLGFAHDKQLRSGLLTDTVVTAKDLMVQPNPPRFVREGDALEFTVKITNMSASPQDGRVRLTFADAATQASADSALGNRVTDQAFSVPAWQSRSCAWKITVPENIGFLTYKAVASSAKLSDGEEGHIPVLSRNILVTESMPLPIRGKSTKQFEFAKLLDSGRSNTLRHQSLTVQMTSQPAWYAVLALPYLMEYPYECNEQVFNRLYANALARHIAGSNPEIRRVFDLWKATPALESPLEKNQAVKGLLIEETPWLRTARNEGEARKRIGALFDANRLDEESSRWLRTLAERQSPEGLWSWFPGGPSSEYITLYIAAGFGRLRQLGVQMDIAPALKALKSLDAAIDRKYRNIVARNVASTYTPDATDSLYLYMRSFFLAEHPIAKEHREAVDFMLTSARARWNKVGCRQSEAHLALGLQRFGDRETPQAIMKSLKERSVTDEELGMFWRDQEDGWWWYRAPIETQALMIEAFAEVANDADAVEACKVWLLKQKQTQDWKTTKATADAVYALLLRGQNLLSSRSLVQVSLGGTTVKPERAEAGTGFYEQTFSRGEIRPEQGRVTVTKTDDGVSWGGVHWQYLEDISKVTPHESTPLTLKKSLFVKETNAKGQILKPVDGPVSVGDELVVRLELRTDRDMEFVHLKDQRGSGVEPVNVLSRYKYQAGLAYYESTRDAASHFFIDHLPKGTHVFEYSTRVQLRGRYQSGIAEIQCMYAPEFNSHSGSIAIEVK